MLLWTSDAQEETKTFSMSWWKKMWNWHIHKQSYQKYAYPTIRVYVYEPKDRKYFREQKQEYMKIYDAIIISAQVMHVWKQKRWSAKKEDKKLLFCDYTHKVFFGKKEFNFVIFCGFFCFRFVSEISIAMFDCIIISNLTLHSAFLISVV